MHNSPHTVAIGIGDRAVASSIACQDPIIRGLRSCVVILLLLGSRALFSLRCRNAAV